VHGGCASRAASALTWSWLLLACAQSTEPSPEPSPQARTNAEPAGSAVAARAHEPGPSAQPGKRALLDPQQGLPPNASPADAPNEEWIATRRQRPAPDSPPSDAFGVTVAEDPWHAILEPPPAHGSRGREPLEPEPTDPELAPIRKVDDSSKPIARGILARSVHCICDHRSELVNAAPVKVRVTVDGPTQRAREVTLIWSTGVETTKGPIADCYRAQLARETFAFTHEKDTVVTHPLYHLSCAGGDVE